MSFFVSETSIYCCRELICPWHCRAPYLGGPATPYQGGSQLVPPPFLILSLPFCLHPLSFCRDPHPLISSYLYQIFLHSLSLYVWRQNCFSLSISPYVGEYVCSCLHVKKFSLSFSIALIFLTRSHILTSILKVIDTTSLFVILSLAVDVVCTHTHTHTHSHKHCVTHIPAHMPSPSLSQYTLM